MAPSDGDALLISRMKRAPGRIITPTRLRCVGPARARNASSVTPANRRASSSPLAATIWPRTPAGSVTARLDELGKNLGCPARRQRLARYRRAFEQVGGFAGCKQQRSAIEDYNVLLGAGRAAAKQRRKARRILLDVAAGDVLERCALQSRF